MVTQANITRPKVLDEPQSHQQPYTMKKSTTSVASSSDAWEEVNSSTDIFKQTFNFRLINVLTFFFRKRGKICGGVAQTQRSRQANASLHGSQVAARRDQLLTSFDVPNPRTVPQCHRHRINLALLSCQLLFPYFFSLLSQRHLFSISAFSPPCNQGRVSSLLATFFFPCTDTGYHEVSTLLLPYKKYCRVLN